MKKAFLFLAFIGVFGCGSEQGSEGGREAVRVVNSGVYTPISFSINGEEIGEEYDLGEWVTASEPILMEVKIKNNTLYPMTDMGFEYPGQTTRDFAFHSEDGGRAEYPGDGGSCGSTLASGASCKVKLTFYVTKSGTYEQSGIFKYKNLVEPDNRAVNFKVLAGQPASLIFDDGLSNNFFFGTKVGMAKKPVLERADIIEYKRSMTISNMGELSATEVSLSLPLSCASSDEAFAGNLAAHSLGTYDPVNFCSGWNLSHDCPRELAPGESCGAEVTFTPPNQDQAWGPDPAIEEIRYQAVVNVAYKSTPSGDQSSLRGTYDTNSTTIQAKFDTSKPAVEFPDEVIVGNYAADIFKVKNSGYREGELRKFIFQKVSGFHGVDKAVCIKAAAGEYLSCFNEDLSARLSLEDFPFVLKGRNNCLRPAGETPYLAQVDEGCIFDIRFQPSVAYTQAYEFKYSLSVEYDARWKGAETIVQKNLFDVSAKSLHAAKVIISKFEFDGISQALLGAVASPQLNESVDLGRLALLSPGFETWRKIAITFQNIGGAPIDLYKAFSGVEGGTTGVVELSGLEQAIGPHSTKYYKDVILDAENCGQGGKLLGDPDMMQTPASKCVVTMLFSPVAMATNQEQNESMFDLPALATPQKVFSFRYHDGSNFSDANAQSDTPDLAGSDETNWKEVNMGITGILIEKGFLADYSEKSVNLGLVYGNTKYRNIIFRNIGTGPISWLPYTGEPIDHESNLKYDNGVARVDVSTPSAYGADYDCNNVFDFDYLAYSAETDPDVVQARLASKSTMGKLETCVLRLRFRASNHMIGTALPGAGQTPMLWRPPRSALFENDILAYPFVGNENKTWDFQVNFFDGDASGQASDPGASDLNKRFGAYFEVGFSHLKSPIEIKADYSDQARLLPVNTQPYMSAVIYRPEINFPGYNYQDDNGTTQAAAPLTAPGEFFVARNRSTDADKCPQYKSCFAAAHAQTVISSMGADSGVDYVIHAGTFPLNTDIPIQFAVANGGGISAGLNSDSLTGAAEFSFDPSYAFVPGPLGLASFSETTGGGYNVPLVFNAASPGQYSALYTVNYDTGRGSDNQTIDLTIRVVAEATNALPVAEIEVEDYDTSSGEILTGSRAPASLGLNHKTSTSTILYDSVQVTERSPTAPYLKKRFYITNNSSVSMTSLEISFKNNPADVDTSTSIGFNGASDRAIKITDETCLTGAPLTLSPGAECYVDIWYQPDLEDTETRINLGVNYDTRPDGSVQHIQKNLSLRFLPRPPSVLRVAGSTEQNVRYRERGGDGTLISGQKAFIVNFGEISYNQVGAQFEFVRTLSNANVDTRGSLLRAYEVHNGLGNSGNDSSDVVDYDSNGYTTVYQEGVMEVRANSICLFGGSVESSEPVEEKGFNSNTAEACRIKIIFKPNFNMIARQLKFTEEDDVSEVYIPLEYYNNKRASVDTLFITLIGKIKPPASTLNAGYEYTGVEADSFSGARIHFEWSPMTPVSGGLGNIIGYRVYYSRFPDEIGNVFDMVLSNASYQDIYTGLNYVTLSSDITDLTSYFIKVVAIRSNVNYTAGIFPGLPSGQYLSFPTISTLKVTVPPPNLFYAHDKRMFISFDILSGIYTYFEAIDACENDLEPIFISTAGGQTSKYFSLINQSAWDEIIKDVSYTSAPYQSEIMLKSHWLKNGVIYDIDGIFAGHPEFSPGETYQYFASTGEVYLRSPQSHVDLYGTDLVAKTEGGFYGNENVTGYAGPGMALGVARCYVQLD